MASTMNIDYNYYETNNTFIHTLMDIRNCTEIPNPNMVKAIYIKCQAQESSEIIIDDIGLSCLANVRSINISGGMVKLLSPKWLPLNIQSLTFANTYICEIDSNQEIRKYLPHLNLLCIDTCNTDNVDVKLLTLKPTSYMKHLMMVDYRLCIWPAMLNQCKGIQQLDLSHNNLKSLPTGLATLLPYLRKLNLSHNRLTNLPALPNSITELELNDNLITDVDGCLPSGCQFLNLANNAIQSLPPDLPFGLLALNISNNPDTEQLPEVLPPFLETLLITGCHINRLPEIMPFNLVTFLAEHNELISINVIWPVSIEQINVQDNHITEIPECIATCKNLRFLNLAQNPLEKRPTANEFSFSGLLNLQSLVLDDTGFTEADVSIHTNCNITTETHQHTNQAYPSHKTSNKISTKNKPVEMLHSVIDMEPSLVSMGQWTPNHKHNTYTGQAERLVFKLKNSLNAALDWLIGQEDEDIGLMA